MADLKITLTRSLIGYEKSQRLTARALGPEQNRLQRHAAEYVPDPRHDQENHACSHC